MIKNFHQIFRWSAPDMSSAAGAKGGPADHWIRDDTAPYCTQCQVRSFLIYETKKIFCLKTIIFTLSIYVYGQKAYLIVNK